MMPKAHITIPASTANAPNTLAPYRRIENSLDLDHAIREFGLSTPLMERLGGAIHSVVLPKTQGSRKAPAADLEGVSIAPPKLLERMSIQNGRRLGYSDCEWRKNRNLVRKALNVTKVYPVVSFKNLPLAPPWMRLLQELPQAHPVRMFARWASLFEISPEHVSDACLPQFETWLSTFGVRHHYRRRFMKAISGWNEAKGTIAGWPQVELRAERRLHNHYSRPLKVWTNNLKGEIDQLFLLWISGGPTQFAAARTALSLSTAKGRKMRLYRALNAYTQLAGLDPGDVQSVAEILNTKILQQILIFTEQWVSATTAGTKGLAEKRALARLFATLASEDYTHCVSSIEIAALKDITRELRQQA